MKAIDGEPKTKNIPELGINIEGLKRHSFMCIFLPESSLSTEEIKLRAWLLHTITSAARHYSKARELVQLQNTANRPKDGGTIFYILDVSEQIEDCIMTTHRVCAALKRMNYSNPINGFSENFDESITQLTGVRNQFEHMHNQIVGGQTGKGPISIVFGSEGRVLKIRKKKMETVKLHHLIESSFQAIAKLYPSFNANSTPETGGQIKLTATATVKVIDNSPKAH